MTAPESPFACDMTAIPVEQRGPHLANIDRIFREVEVIHELTDGYVFHLPNESDALLAAAEFIVLERLCCPFFGLDLTIEGEDGPVCLTVTGREGVKPIIMAEIGEHLPLNVRPQNS